MRIITLFIGITFSIGLVFSQGTSKTDKVKLVKIKFFNEKLDLNSEESKKFWPIYNDYQNRKSLLSSERRNIMRFYIENKNNMSDQEITETLDRYIEIEKEQTALLERYNDSFKRFLPDEKVLSIYIVEVQFKNYLLKQLRTGKQDMKLRN